jgi:hypothetical protein
MLLPLCGLLIALPLLPHLALACSPPQVGVVLGPRIATGRAAGHSFADCCDQCTARGLVACRAFTFEAEESRCYFKNATEPATPKAAAVSGTVGPPPPPPPPLPPPPSPPLAPPITRANITVDLQRLLSVTDPGFKSWTIDGSLNRQWKSRDLADRTLRSLARQSNAGAPGYLRFGGGGNDLLHYALDMGDLSSPGNKCRSGRQALCVNRTQFDNLHSFAEAAGAKLVFGLAMPGHGEPGRQSSWNSSDARALISYAISTNRSIYGFELGNEQCGVFTAAETAQNFAALGGLLAEMYPTAATRPRLLGPDPWGFHVSLCVCARLCARQKRLP